MGRETESNVSGWSTDTALLYNRAVREEQTRRLEERIDYVEKLAAERDRRYTELAAEREKAMHAAFESAKLAVDKAEANSEKWRASANEWRGAMGDRERQFMQRSEVEAKFDAITQMNKAVVEQQARSEGRNTGLKDYVGYVAVLIALLALLSRFVVK